MTTPIIKLKIFPKPVIKGKMDVRFPANVAVQNFLTVARANGKYTFDIDYTLLSQSTITDPTAVILAVLNEVSGLYEQISLASLLASSLKIEQHITTAGPIAINNNTGIVRVDQATGRPSR